MSSWPGINRKTRLIFMIIVTFLFFMVEIIVGYVSKSNALIADAFHMISDVIALFIAFISVHISPKTWSKNTFGFARAEVLGALTNAVFLIALCFSIFTSSIQRFIEPTPITQPLMVLIVGAIGLGCNVVGLCLFHEHGHAHSGNVGGDEGGHSEEQHNHGKKHHNHDDVELGRDLVQKQSNKNVSIRGVFLHLMADALGSVIVIVSALVIYLNSEWEYKDYVDPSLSIIMVLIITCSTWPLLKDSAYILLQTVPNYMEVAELRERLLTEVPEIDSVHDFHIWQLVATRVVASIHVRVPEDRQGDHMKNAKKIKDFFHRQGIHATTVQIEYITKDRRKAGNLFMCDLPCPTADDGKALPDCGELMCCPEDAKVAPTSRIVIIRKGSLDNYTERR